MVLDAACNHVTSSAAPRCSTIKFIPILGCKLKPASKFSIAYTACKKSAKIIAIVFHRNTGTDPLEKKLDPKGTIAPLHGELKI